MFQLRARACLAIWLRVPGNCSQSSAVPGQSSSCQDRGPAVMPLIGCDLCKCASEHTVHSEVCKCEQFASVHCAQCVSVQVCTVCKARDLVVCAMELHSRCLGILLSVSWLELVSKQLFSPKQKSLSLL